MFWLFFSIGRSLPALEISMAMTWMDGTRPPSKEGVNIFWITPSLHSRSSGRWQQTNGDTSPERVDQKGLKHFPVLLIPYLRFAKRRSVPFDDGTADRGGAESVVVQGTIVISPPLALFH